ncbi:MAG: hypothetical protein ACYTF6_12895, partial [Planctomycetota bacterium]
MKVKKLIASATVVMTLLALAASAGAEPEWTWTEILGEDFNADPSSNWSFSGRQNGSAQDLLRWNSGGYVDAEWDQLNYYLGGEEDDPYIIEPSSYSRSLGQTLTDQQTFKVGAKLRINSVASTTEYYQVANFGLYDLTYMGPDRMMSDNWSGNTNLVKDACDFVEWNYFINNDDLFEWYPNTCATMGAHITGLDGEYITGSGIYDPEYFHDTDMG